MNRVLPNHMAALCFLSGRYVMSEQKKLIRDLTAGSTPKTLYTLAVPVMIILAGLLVLLPRRNR